MINNLQDLFLKYKNKISSSRNIREKILSLLIDFNFIKEENIIIDLNKKTIHFKNLKSSHRFILKNEFEDIKEKIEKEIDFKINLNK